MGRRKKSERYTELKVKNRNLMPSLLGDGFLLTILGNNLFSKSEACKRKTRRRGGGGKAREEAGRGKENRERGLHFPSCCTLETLGRPPCP